MATGSSLRDNMSATAVSNSPKEQCVDKGKKVTTKETAAFPCSYRCSYIGTSQAKLNKHKTACSLATVKCNGCQVAVKRSEIDQHRKTCSYIYDCPYCHSYGSYDTIAGPHFKKCHQGKEKGISGAADQLKPNTHASKGADHASSTAREEGGLLLSSEESSSSTELQLCPYSDVGCEALVTEDGIEDHEADFAGQHLGLAMELVQELSDKIDDLEKQMSERSATLSKSIASLTVHTPPRVFQLSGFSQKKCDREQWFSPSFYSHAGGYKMCLRVDATGDGEGNSNHTSLFVCMMKGENDERLVWPFAGEVTVDLLNQLDDCNHFAKVVSFLLTAQQSCGGRVMDAGRSRTGLGFLTYVPHSRLEYDDVMNTQYLREDCLYFRVSKVEVDSAYRPWLSVTD